MGWLLGLRVLQGKQIVQVAFFLFRRPTINGKSKQAVARMWGVYGTHAFSIFPAPPTHRVRALWHIPYRWVQRSSEKTLAAFVSSALR